MPFSFPCPNQHLIPLNAAQGQEWCFIFYLLIPCLVANITAALATAAKAPVEDRGSSWCASGPPKQGSSHHHSQEQGVLGAWGTASALSTRYHPGKWLRPHCTLSPSCLNVLGTSCLAPLFLNSNLLPEHAAKALVWILYSPYFVTFLSQAFLISLAFVLHSSLLWISNLFCHLYKHLPCPAFSH